MFKLSKLHYNYIIIFLNKSSAYPVNPWICVYLFIVDTSTGGSIIMKFTLPLLIATLDINLVEF